MKKGKGEGESVGRTVPADFGFRRRRSIANKSVARGQGKGREAVELICLCISLLLAGDSSDPSSSRFAVGRSMKGVRALFALLFAVIAVNAQGSDEKSKLKRRKEMMHSSLVVFYFFNEEIQNNNLDG